MIFIDGKGVVLGRLANFVAKQALKGEEVKILNADKVIITGNPKTTEREFLEKRSRFGHSQKGPKHHATSEKIVKRSIRGMLPDHRESRGREAFKRIMCYSGIPTEFQEVEMIVMPTPKKIKYSEVKNFTKLK
ncbi:MAG: 50S ribosomal protein L13 [Nanoarchaeota archaeon]|jgi:large subunit ribosomal protein L13|nr:50S ribosomal protein L13 [Nanoarchaeota archaeon]